ncbi:hypothetical protein [Brachybacterium aquaticum]|uniref:Uncharacterized protein n=1 Tax=Brachybacterium aquaticum TaxID=1432564 RepID=A0A841AH38_9MICO|nr:hypothetical protein [Brachybacterium aquaticum]MBB5832645.1 hypothetical protein [Brachybacterium aquaticum]
MKPVDELRDRLAEVRRRAEAGTARSLVLADARAVMPEIPRDADAGHLERAARRLVRRAAQDDFAREGITRIPVPRGTTRAALREADVAGDARFHAVVEDVLSGIDIGPSPLEADDAVALRDSRTSADAYGLSPEAASDLASYLLGLAFTLREDEHDLDAYLARHEAQIRQDVREALVRTVRVPLELKVARDRHNRIESGLRPEPDDVRPTGAAGGAVRSGASGWGGGGGGRAGGAADGADGSGGRGRLSAQARAAMDRAQAEAGKAALGVLRSGAGRAFERYGRGAESRGADSRGAESRGAESRGAESRGAEWPDDPAPDSTKGGEHAPPAPQSPPSS